MADQTIEDQDFLEGGSWRKKPKLCTRLSLKIRGTFFDVINDVTSDVIFHLKKLILNSILHNKGGKFESSSCNIHERASSGLSKNRSRFANRPSWAALRCAQSWVFSSFWNEIGKSHYGPTMHVLWLFTRLHMCLSGLELCLRVGKKFSWWPRAPEMTS